MKSIKTWIAKIKSANSEMLDKISQEWKAEGCNFKPCEWYDVWAAFTDRKLELAGIDPFGPQF